MVTSASEATSGKEGRQHMVPLAGELLANAGTAVEDKADFPFWDV